MWVRRTSVLIVALLFTLETRPAYAQPDPSDDYLAGYSASLLRDAWGIEEFTLDVSDGRISIELDPGSIEIDSLARALLAIEGVRHVEIRDQDGDVITSEAADDDDAEARSGWELFPAEELFAPLVADPRWPHFSASYGAYLSDDELDQVADVSFGGSFALLRSPSGLWELGFQAGVFSVFDLEGESFDLVNSDFLVGATLTRELGDFTALLRLYHQSSHLGDEYLLRTRVDRVNLSFEVLDLLISYDPVSWFRLYGGGGLLVHSDPDDLERWITQTGIELVSPKAFFGGYIRPVAATDLQFRQESDWKTDLSTRAGFQIEHPRLRRLRIQLLAAYYNGRSPNGQFYGRRIETVGVGLHLWF